MKINDILQRAGTSLALAGALVAVEGVLADCFFFIPLGLHVLPTLTMGDHLSTAAAHLPFLGIGLVLGHFIGGWTNDTPIARDVRKGKSSWWLWFIIGTAVIGSVTGIVLQNYASATWSIGTLAMFAAIFYGHRLMADYDKVTRDMLVALVVTTIVLCSSGTTRGFALLAVEQPSVTISTDGNNRQSGVLIGVFDRGSLFLLKPSNRLLFVSQRTNLIVEDIQENPPNYARRDAITTWLKRQFGRSN